MPHRKLTVGYILELRAEELRLLRGRLLVRLREVLLLPGKFFLLRGGLLVVVLRLLR